jgi:hypothetical protein
MSVNNLSLLSITGRPLTLKVFCRDVVRWGRNIETGQRRASRRAGSKAYSSASALETLVSQLFPLATFRFKVAHETCMLCARPKAYPLLR